MKKLFNWTQFNEAKGDKFLMPLYTSEKFFNKVTKLKTSKGINAISDVIKSIVRGVNPIYDITCIDFNSEINDEVTFIQTSRIKRTLSLEIWSNDSDDDINQFYTGSGRTTLKIGRFIKRILPSVADKDIEIFVNLWKSTFSDNAEFKIVSGKEISEWYKEEKYADGGGSLNSSCMKSALFVELYDQNPQTVNLLILINKENKLLGRSLIWKLTQPEGRIFMDRIYTVNDYDINKFKEYAIERDYIYKHTQTYGEGFSNWESHITATINDGEYRRYPYMDTLFIYDSDNGILMSDPQYEYTYMNYNYLKLRDTQGLATNADAWDDWNKCPRNSDDLVYCKNIDGYCNSEDAIFLEYLEEHYAPNDDICYDEIAAEHYLDKDCVLYTSNDGNVYSVYKNNLVNVIIDLETNKTQKMHKKELTVCNVGTTFYLKELCFLNKRGVWVASLDGVVAYRRNDIIYSIDTPSIRERNSRFEGAYMTIEDSKKYNKPIDMNVSLRISKEDYDYVKWVGLEDSKDIPEHIRIHIRMEISNHKLTSMYYKWHLYKIYGVSDRLNKSINGLKINIIESSDNNLDEFLKKYKTGDKYKFEVMAFDDNDTNIVTEKMPDDELDIQYIFLSKEELLDRIKKIYIKIYDLWPTAYKLHRAWKEISSIEWHSVDIDSDVFDDIDDFILDVKGNIPDFDEVNSYVGMCDNDIVYKWEKSLNI